MNRTTRDAVSDQLHGAAREAGGKKREREGASRYAPFPLLVLVGGLALLTLTALLGRRRGPTPAHRGSRTEQRAARGTETLMSRQRRHATLDHRRRDADVADDRRTGREGEQQRAPFPLLVLIAGLAVMAVAIFLGRDERQTGARMVDASVSASLAATETGRPVHAATFAPVERPAGLALGPDGSVYVVDSALGRVTVFEADGSIARTLGRPSEDESPTAGAFLNPFGVAVDAEGRAFVSDLKTGLISVFDAEGRVTGFFVGPGLAGTSPGALLYRNGLLYVSDLRGQRVLALNEIGEAVRTLSANAEEPMNYPNGIWVEANGAVLVSDTNNDRVLWFPPDSDDAEVLSASFLGPRGLVVDASGRLYVAETLAHRVTALDAGDEESFNLSGAGGMALGFPVGVATDGERLYVTDRAARGVQIWQLPEPD
jgi:sugar lactone lactonase YvrE